MWGVDLYIENVELYTHIHQPQKSEKGVKIYTVIKASNPRYCLYSQVNDYIIFLSGCTYGGIMYEVQTVKKCRC